MTTNTFDAVSREGLYYAELKMLEYARPIITLSDFAQTSPLPPNKTKTIKFRRPVPLTIDKTGNLPTPLTEGVTPVAKQLNYVDVEATVNQYGDLIQITDVVKDTAVDAHFDVAAQLAGEAAAEKHELIAYGIAKGGTNVFYSNGTQRNQVNTVPSLSLLQRVSRALKANRARKITNMVAASPNYATAPTRASYLIFAHTDAEPDFEAISGFVHVSEYGSPSDRVHDQEYGSIGDFRIITSPVLESYPDAGTTAGSTKSTTGTNSDVYPMIVLARDGLGCVPLRGKGSLDPFIIQPDTRDKSDPMGQRGYVSTKFYDTAVRLNESFMAVIETAVSAL